MRSTFEQIERSRHGGESGSECKTACAAFEIGDALFVSKPGRIDRARIIVAFMFARTFLDVSRCCVNRRHDRAGGRIGLLTGVNRAGGELVLFLHLNLFYPRITRMNANKEKNFMTLVSESFARIR